MSGAGGGTNGAATWRLRVVHTTTFVYEGPVRGSYNEVRQAAARSARQTPLESAIRTEPHAGQYGYRDYWGSHVVAFNVDGAHSTLVVEGTSVVDTRPQAPPADADWETVRLAADRWSEYLEPTRYTHLGPPLHDVAASLRAASPLETARAVMSWVNRSLEYEPGTTHVHTSAGEAFTEGRGVCQDFAHLSVAVLRAVGVPARYVSGYLHPDPRAEVGVEASGESHAWVECWTGEWWGFDPTNDQEIGLRHVEVAKGRDYGDVPPVKGIYAGPTGCHTTARVTVARVA